MGVRKGGIDKPGALSFAVDMASSMGDNITKELLAAQAQDYIEQVNNMHALNQSKGESKKTEIVNNQQTESKNLTAELANLEEQLELLKTTIADRKRKLETVSHKYEPQLHDVEQRLMANDLVKNQMVVELEKVKNGLQNL